MKILNKEERIKKAVKDAQAALQKIVKYVEKEKPHSLNVINK